MRILQGTRAVILTAAVPALIVIGGFFIFIYSGVYNVAASKPHTAFTRWAFRTTMVHSVRHHAKGITVSPLRESAKPSQGFAHYNEMCVTCHGAPGVPMDEIGQGLNPAGPYLPGTVKDWTPSELYWIVKNGIKMTGMPAFGVTHSEEELWAIVGFLERLPAMSEEEYRSLGKKQGAGTEHEETAEPKHEHSEGTAPSERQHSY